MAPDIHGLGARVSTKGSNAESVLNPCLPNDVAPVEPLMGLCNASPEFCQQLATLVVGANL
ncbi:hypothetical protein JHK82_051113 [Glycine max]|nr:hypothetical protein JHK82_051113 [Glycine max]